jgi:hypothetical protein
MPVRCVSYSRDGAWLAAAGDDGLIKVLTVEDQRVGAAVPPLLCFFPLAPLLLLCPLLRKCG